MLKASRGILVLGLICFAAASRAVPGQEPSRFGDTQALGFSTSWSGTSSHIFIGESERRRVWTLGAEYSHLLHSTHHLRLDYEGSILPLYEETDPTVIGTSITVNGQQIVTQQNPVRVIYIPKGPIGTVLVAKGVTVPVYAITGREDTYAALISPIGARIAAFPRNRVQPTFSLDLGFVVSARDIPVNDATQFNFMFAFGPGIQVFRDAHTAWRFDYLYRHTSNAGEGAQNPGVDQGVLRVTLTLYR